MSICPNQIFEDLVDRIGAYYVAGLLFEEKKYFEIKKHQFYAIYVEERGVSEEFIYLLVDRLGNIKFYADGSMVDKFFPFENEVKMGKIARESRFQRFRVYGESETVTLTADRSDKDKVIQIIDLCLPYLF